MTFSASNVVDNYKSRTGVTAGIPNLVILVEEFYNEMKNNGEIIADPGKVTGSCPSGGGPLSSGAVSGAKFT